MQKDLKRTCTAIVLLIKPLFGDVLLTVVVVVCLSFLLAQQATTYEMENFSNLKEIKLFICFCLDS